MKFVRINLYGDGLEIWGLLTEFTHREFTVLWSTDMKGAQNEFGIDIFNGVIDAEVASAVDAEKCDTPDEAWAALAAYQLTKSV